MTAKQRVALASNRSLLGRCARCARRAYARWDGRCNSARRGLAKTMSLSSGGGGGGETKTASAIVCFAPRWSTAGASSLFISGCIVCAVNSCAGPICAHSNRRDANSGQASGGGGGGGSATSTAAAAAAVSGGRRQRAPSAASERISSPLARANLIRRKLGLPRSRLALGLASLD